MNEGPVRILHANEANVDESKDSQNMPITQI